MRIRKFFLLTLFLISLILLLASNALGQDGPVNDFQYCPENSSASSVIDINTNDPFSCLQWHLGQYPGISLQGILESEPYHKFGEDVTVAVIDTGVRWRDNRDLSPTNFTKGFDFINKTLINDSEHSLDTSKSLHGTHVASIIAQATNNEIGAAGIAPGVKIMPIRVSKHGKINPDLIAKGIEWATANGAQVINLSLGISIQKAEEPVSVETQESIQKITNAIEAAYRKRVVMVAAAGNIASGQTSPGLFSELLRSDKVITVTAHDRNGKITNYSNPMNGADISAPGGYDIHIPNGCSKENFLNLTSERLKTGAILQMGLSEREGTQQALICFGTSQATAQVSAVTALVISHYIHCHEWGKLRKTNAYEISCSEDAAKYTADDIRKIILESDKRLVKFYAYESSSYSDFLLPLKDDLKVHYLRTSKNRKIPMLNANAIEWAAYADIQMKTKPLKTKERQSYRSREDGLPIQSKASGPNNFWWILVLPSIGIIGIVVFLRVRK